jgi:hypothetical protein
VPVNFVLLVAGFFIDMMRVLGNHIIKATLYRKDGIKQLLDVTNLRNEYTDIFVDVDGSGLIVSI